MSARASCSYASAAEMPPWDGASSGKPCAQTGTLPESRAARRKSGGRRRRMSWRLRCSKGPRRLPRRRLWCPARRRAWLTCRCSSCRWAAKAGVHEAYDASLPVAGPGSELAGQHAAHDPESSLGTLALLESNRAGAQLSRTRGRSIYVRHRNARRPRIGVGNHHGRRRGAGYSCSESELARARGCRWSDRNGSCALDQAPCRERRSIHR